MKCLCQRPRHTTGLVAYLGQAMDDNTERQLRALFDYMAGWNANHMRGVTQHEIQMMHTAAAEGRRILDAGGQSKAA